MNGRLTNKHQSRKYQGFQDYNCEDRKYFMELHHYCTIQDDEEFKHLVDTNPSFLTLSQVLEV